MSKNPMRSSRMTVTFLACMLMPYACTVILDGVHADSVQEAVLTGAVLGIVYLAARPVLRLCTLPVGCLTLGLSNFAIDVLLLLLCDRWMPGFQIDGPGWAAAASVCINAVVLIAGGWK